MRLLVPIALALAVAVPPAAAAPADVPFALVPVRHAHDPWQISWVPAADLARPVARSVSFDVPAGEVAAARRPTTRRSARGGGSPSSTATGTRRA